MLQFIVGTAIGVGFGLAYALYLQLQANESYSHSFDNGTQYRNREKTTPPPLKQIKNSKVDKCAICLDFMNSSVGIDLKCGHTFHTNCLVDLIKEQHKKCPSCESDIEIRNN